MEEALDQLFLQFSRPVTVKNFRSLLLFVSYPIRMDRAKAPDAMRATISVKTPRLAVPVLIQKNSNKIAAERNSAPKIMFL